MNESGQLMRHMPREAILYLFYKGIFSNFAEILQKEIEH